MVAATESGTPATGGQDGEDLEPQEEPASPGGLRGLAVRWRRWWWPAGFVLLGIVLLAAYLVQARSQPALSSSAGQALQAWDMWHGNFLLRGWTLSDVSFWSTELPEYALVEMVRGLNGDTVHVAAALAYTLVVVLGAALAKGRATGREALVRVTIAVTIMLAPSLLFGTKLLLAGPDHIGTQAPLLLTWLVLDRRKAYWWAPVVAALLLGWALIADPLVLYEGVLPLLVVCAVRMYRRRGPLAGQWYELSLIGAALASVIISQVVLDAVRQAGGFLVKTPYAAFASASALSVEIWIKIQAVLSVFGANFLGLPFGEKALFALIHLVGVILVAVAVGGALRRFYREDDLVTQGLLVGFAIVLVAYLFATKSDPNEIVGLLPFGAVLAGRVLGGRMLQAGFAPALALFVVCMLIVFAHTLDKAARPYRASRNQVAATWLKAHHLDYGLAGYWNANSVTADSGGVVKVRPARMYAHQMVTTLSESDINWYNASRHDARYVLLAPAASCWNVCLNGHDIRVQYGYPAKVYKLGHWRVWVYNRNLLAGLPVDNWCKAWSWTSNGMPSSRGCPSGKLF
ncbi:MAG: hypothetical protein ACLQDY_04810 [Streptosporangiaceae bacterium]